MGCGTNIRMAWAVQTARKGLGKSKSKGARVPASRVHQAYVEKTMQSRMISPDRHLGVGRSDRYHGCVKSRGPNVQTASSLPLLKIGRSILRRFQTGQLWVDRAV